MASLDDLFYAPGGATTAAALYKEAKAAGMKVTRKAVERFVRSQPLYQRFREPRGPVKHGHWTVSEPNHTHQMDLLFLPTDMRFKYALVVVDVASRYKEARPLTTKNANAVLRALEDIYANSPLKWPRRQIVHDRGAEFSAVDAEATRRGIRVRLGTVGRHRDVAFAEAANKAIGKALFRAMEIHYLRTGKESNRWVMNLPRVIEALNARKTRMIGMAPAKAIRREWVKQPSSGGEFTGPVLLRNTRVRVRLEENQERAGRKRATDPVWSSRVYFVDGYGRGRYYVRDAEFNFLPHTFDRNSLLVVPDDTPERADARGAKYRAPDAAKRTRPQRARRSRRARKAVDRGAFVSAMPAKTARRSGRARKKVDRGAFVHS